MSSVATGTARVVAMAVYGSTLVVLFGASSTYHFFDWGDRGNRWLRRLDHSAIFLLIAGSYLPACVVLKVFPLAGGEASFDATGAIRSATRAQRAAFAVYAGFNGSVRVRGVRPPRRLQPSPLNLIIRRLEPELDQDAIELDTFEFLVMDAY